MKRFFDIFVYVIVFLFLLFFTGYEICYDYDSFLSEILGDIEKVDIEDKAGWYSVTLHDCHTVEIYTLSDETIKEFEDLKIKKLNLKPLEEASEWRKIEWHKTPVDSAFEKNITKATEIPLYGKGVRLALEIRKITNIVQQAGSYYAFYYLPFTGGVPEDERNKINPRHVRFFLLDTCSKKLLILSA